MLRSQQLLNPQSDYVGSKQAILKLLKPIAEERGWKISDLRKMSKFQLRAIYNKTKA
jgi:hypothetical protein